MLTSFTNSFTFHQLIIVLLVLYFHCLLGWVAWPLIIATYCRNLPAVLRDRDASLLHIQLASRLYLRKRTLECM